MAQEHANSQAAASQAAGTQQFNGVGARRAAAAAARGAPASLALADVASTVSLNARAARMFSATARTASLPSCASACSSSADSTASGSHSRITCCASSAPARAARPCYGGEDKRARTATGACSVATSLRLLLPSPSRSPHATAPPLPHALRLRLPSQLSSARVRTCG